MQKRPFAWSSLWLSTLLLICLVAWQGCKKESASEPPIGENPPVQYTIRGTVYRIQYQPAYALVPLAGATVRLDSATASVASWTTDSSGAVAMSTTVLGAHRVQIVHPGIVSLDTSVTFVAGNNPPVQFLCQAAVVVDPRGKQLVYPLSAGRLWRYSYSNSSNFKSTISYEARRRGIHTWLVVGVDPQGRDTVVTVSDTRRDTLHVWTQGGWPPLDTTYFLNETKQFTIRQTPDSLYLNLPDDISNGGYCIPPWDQGLLRFRRFPGITTDTLRLKPAMGSFVTGTGTTYVSGIGLTGYDLWIAGNSSSSEAYVLVESRTQ